MTQRVALITGSTDGIGRATARALAAAGTKVILHGRSKPKVDAALAQLFEELPGAELEGISFDLGSTPAIKKAALSESGTFLLRRAAAPVRSNIDTPSCVTAKAVL